MTLIEKKIKNLTQKVDVTRQELQDLCVELSHEQSNIFINWCTRLGKSKCIMEIVKSHGFKKVLFVCSQNVHIKNFQDDCKKFDFDLTPYTFICWNSYGKYVGHWDAIIQDEFDHSIDNHIAFLESTKVTFEHVYFLTATVSPDQESKLKEVINYFKWSISSSQAMDWKILPLPTVYLKPITLNKSQDLHLKNIERYLEKLKEEADVKGWNNTVDDKLVPSWEALKVLKKGNERKAFFQSVKTNWFISDNIFNRLKDKRTIFFLPDINDNKRLGNSVSSLESSKANNKVLEDFNNGKISYIVSKKILIRGVNLYNINFGYFGFIDMNGTSLIQSTARVLLGVAPNIIIPYVKNSKEEQVLERFLHNFKCTIKYF